MSSLYGKLEADVEIEAPPSKFHEMIQKRPHHVSNAAGDKVQGCNLHEGDWGTIGSIISVNYFHDGKAQMVKHVIEAVDEENNLISSRIIEGDLLEHYKTFKFTMQAFPKGKGSTVHWTLEYEKLHEGIPDSHTLLEFCVDVSKDIDTHLVKGN